MDARIAKGLVAVGTPDECIKNVQRYADIGADQLTFGMLSSTMPIETCVEAIETFGGHVLPQFDTDPVHRTTRHREAAVAVSAA
jgi:alkanesulfonate monooxygenase SsuD/methylene tetrahydromethanopterin reductase-like flavin-dependent oxidoreductase (luciferase family)